MEQWKGKTAFITGASAGIGYNICSHLCEKGMNVVGVSRNVEKIEELSKKMDMATESGKILAVRCDVQQEHEIKAAFKKAVDVFGSVEVCINNAGLAHNAPLLSGTTDEWRNMLEVNVLGLCVCTREFMTQMKEKGKDEGHIILINSISGHEVSSGTFYNTHFYSATKFAVTALTEGIRRELQEMKNGVKVTSISPGIVKTEFMPRCKKADNIEEMKEQYGAPGQYLEAEDVTSAVVYTLSTPPRMQIHDILVRPLPRT